MTEYFEHGDTGVVSDATQTVGIVTDGFFPEHGGEVEWVTGVNPQILRELADLVEFCYPETRGVLDIGLAPSQFEDDGRPPALVIGKADGDRYTMAAPRLDCFAGPNGDEEVTDDE